MIVDILDFESSLVPWNAPIVLVILKAKHHRYNLQVPELFDGCRNRQWKPESRKRRDKMESDLLDGANAGRKVAHHSSQQVSCHCHRQ